MYQDFHQTYFATILLALRAAILQHHWQCLPILPGHSRLITDHLLSQMVTLLIGCEPFRENIRHYGLHGRNSTPSGRFQVKLDLHPYCGSTSSHEYFTFLNNFITCKLIITTVYFRKVIKCGHMSRVLAKYRPPSILMIFHLKTNLSPKRTNLKVIFT